MPNPNTTRAADAIDLLLRHNWPRAAQEHAVVQPMKAAWTRPPGNGSISASLRVAKRR